MAYSRLVVFSFGFQQAYQRGIQPGDDVYFNKVHVSKNAPSGFGLIHSQCLDAAKSVIRNMVENLAPTGYMRYAPDGMLRIPRTEFCSPWL